MVKKKFCTHTSRLVCAISTLFFLPGRFPSTIVFALCFQHTSPALCCVHVEAASRVKYARNGLFAWYQRSVVGAVTYASRNRSSRIYKTSEKHGKENPRVNNENIASFGAQLSEGIGLQDRFARWRYLQRILDGEVKSRDVNSILYVVLDGFLRYPRPRYRTTDETGTRELSPELRGKITKTLEWNNARENNAPPFSVPLLFDDIDEIKNDENQVLLREWLENEILPDPITEEDLATELWDIVMDLHGREAVRIDKSDSNWQRLCLAVRILLCYDFLIYGILTGPITA
jgi:hypothetical protein